jgi:hypothetical protein
MTELADGLIAWVLVNVLVASGFLFGGWRRKRAATVPRGQNPSPAARGFGVAASPGKPQ